MDECKCMDGCAESFLETVAPFLNERLGLDIRVVVLGEFAGIEGKIGANIALFRHPRDIGAYPLLMIGRCGGSSNDVNRGLWWLFSRGMYIHKRLVEDVDGSTSIFIPPFSSVKELDMKLALMGYRSAGTGSEPPFPTKPRNAGGGGFLTYA